MTVSAITTATTEGQALSTGLFRRNGVVYLLWSIQAASGKVLQWKPHTAGGSTEVTGRLSAEFSNLTCLIRASDGALVVVWDDEGLQGTEDGSNLLQAAFHPDTGALLSGPLNIGPGMRPSLLHRGGDTTAELLLVYALQRQQSIFLRYSTDGAQTWSGAKPVLSNRVRNTQDIVAIPFDDQHISLLQLGEDSRPLKEIAVLTRSRPLAKVLRHPSLSNRILVSEPSYLSPSQLSDTGRGGLVFSSSQNRLYHLQGVRLGSSDGRGSVCLIDTLANPPTILESVAPTGDGDDLAEMTLSPLSLGMTTDLFTSAAVAVGLDCSTSYGYVAGRSEAGNLGTFLVVRLSDRSLATVLSNVEAVHGVAVGLWAGSPTLIFVSTQEAGVSYLRVYEENGLTPTLLKRHKLPSRANGLFVVRDSASTSRLVSALQDRLNIYQLASPSSPLQLQQSQQLLTGGVLFNTRALSNGNLVCAAGSAGIIIFDTHGTLLAQTAVSGLVMNEWAPGTSYAPGALVRPRSSHPFARQEQHFLCTAGGTSGLYEPPWISTGTVSDAGTLRWVSQGQTSGVVFDVETDAVRDLIFAVGVAGGYAGTAGRVWVLSARGLLR
jgi:hypothetical protein